MLRPKILGINFVYHQPSACVVIDGVVACAVEEERLNRVKGGKPTHVDHTLVLPFGAIDRTLAAAGIAFRDIDLIATSFSTERRRLHAPELTKHQPILQGNFETDAGNRAFNQLVTLAPEVLAARYSVTSAFVTERFRWVPHHLAHIASAFYPSAFDSAAAMVIDGIGEYETATLADCDGAGIRILEETYYPNSLGFVWELLTSFLGFEGNHDESKIMGLAAYGNPDRFRDALRRLVTVGADGRFVTHLDGTALTDNFSSLETALGVRRRLPYEPLAWQGQNRNHANLAAALQEITSEVFIRQAETLRLKTGRRQLVLAGGVCLNCVANGAIAEHCGFDDIYVQPATGDAGTCVGAALHVLRSEAGTPSAMKPLAMPTPFVGPAFSDDEIRMALEKFRLDYEVLDDPADYAAEFLAKDKIIGWFQGAMEFGPRALGNRSLLANPTTLGIRHTLNLKVKHREEFRPFCPTILAEDASEWFDHARPLTKASRWMLMTHQVKHAKRSLIPDVLHMDGSSRVQVLQRDDNPLFYALIENFKRRTGVPIVLNTSFNDQEPIVCTPEDACKCYLKTRFDAMILGSYLVVGPKPWEREPRLSFFEMEARNFDSFGSASTRRTRS